MNMGLDDGSYKILVHKKFEKIVTKKLPSYLVKVLNKKIEYLKSNPKHPSLNTKSLNVSEVWCRQRGIDDAFEFRITMSFRCVFYVLHERKEIILMFVGNHDDIAKYTK